MIAQHIKDFMVAQNVDGNARLALFVLAVDADNAAVSSLAWVELIGLMGVSRATVSRAIAALKDAKLIEAMGAPEPGYRLPGLAEQCEADRAGWPSRVIEAPQEALKADPFLVESHTLTTTEAAQLRGEMDRVNREGSMQQIEQSLEQWKNPTVRLADPKPAQHASDVRRVLEAARIPPDPREPLYWSRFEHRADLQTLLARLRIDVDELVRRLAASPPAPQIKRLIALQDHVSKKR